MKIKGAIFDLDGTLIDSMGEWASLPKKYMMLKGLSYTDSINQILYSMSLTKAAEYLQREFGITDSRERIISDFIEIVKPFYLNEAEIKPAALEFLKMLRADGVKMCIATATDVKLAEAALKRNGIYGYFGEIFTCEGVGKGKNSPEIFNAAHSFLGTDKEFTWVFEDSSHAAATAKRAGFKVCGVADRYSDGKIKEFCDLYINSFDEI